MSSTICPVCILLLLLGKVLHLEMMLIMTRNSGAGSDLEGLHYLRNTRDADKLVQAIQETKTAGGKVRSCDCF